MKNSKIKIGDNVRLIHQSNFYKGKTGVVINELSKQKLLITFISNGVQKTTCATRKGLELI
jgi:ribosomal protein L21E